jgi:A/G-specific adenine glycosylase
MLQQTQVATVLPYYQRWMRELPNFQALAAADEARVLKLWEGLGYYCRARNLHALARRLVDSGVPSSVEGWLAMPGVGPYAAAAIGSIAQGLPAAIVDGNVVRIVVRIMADATQFPAAGVAVKAVAPLAAALLDPSAPGRHNEAMMELGATVCVKARPACGICPVRAWCRAGLGGSAEALPNITRPRTRNVTIHRAWLLREGALLLERLPADAPRLAGCWELPRMDPETVAGWRLLARKSRGISNERITEEIWAPVDDAALGAVAAAHRSRMPAPGALGELPELRLSGPHRKWITDLLGRA